MEQHNIKQPSHFLGGGEGMSESTIHQPFLYVLTVLKSKAKSQQEFLATSITITHIHQHHHFYPLFHDYNIRDILK